ncbi:hypothetical protein B5F44_11085 [Gordonibacter urolithinfaciens]|uniref:Uncharacterized protein n=4 Tax=Eggerthellaceae TaxID=1643826 RepID=A0A6N8IKC0_9ACTN|nr:hypothetical protein [Gordonibacter urolithinfaciens]MVN16278.1 hypothetical protein [Gordonibacter urolithinfaciens]MVN39606.1 hypothetical protein [Gordonibacter urolithinfaciens]MVN57067.1 hypothetical protein [Gordonibacter urolithinfaciens]MVN62207.1 hypothetical protein [Gordonibacter urolithinfaciens]
MAMLKISTDKLMLVAGIVWAIAGANIANIGLTAYQHDWGWVIWALLVGSAVIFVLFHSRIFQKMVGKHAKRIGGYEEAKTNILKFFDKKGYIMMAIMMGGGIGLRMSGLVPDWFIAFFYTGLGIALTVAGLTFLLRYFMNVEPGCPLLPHTYAKRG